MQTTTIARLLCFLAVLCFASAVFKGDNVPPGLYRFLVDMYSCGGVLISSKFVLTSAHCERTVNRLLMEVSTRSVHRVVWTTSLYKRRFPIETSDTIVNKLYAEGLDAEVNGEVLASINDIAILELKEPVSVCDNVFGPLAILLPLNPEETAENMIKKDKYHQCIQAGFGRQIDKDETDDPTRATQMMQQRIERGAIWQFPGVSGTLYHFWSDKKATSCEGDHGSPIFCIINDQPTMVSLVSTTPACGTRNDTPTSGPSIRQLLSFMKNEFTIKQWDELMAEQKKCRGYYKKNGFLTEYVGRVKANKYPPKDDFPDSFVYPSVDKISMDGSYPVPVTQPLPVPVPVPVPVQPASNQTNLGPLPPARLTSISLNLYAPILALVVSIVLAH